MKTITSFLIGATLIVASFGFANAAEAATRVKGYWRSNGTYVESYYRSDRNNSRYDNWSTRGNYNPYTGKAGTRNVYTW